MEIVTSFNPFILMGSSENGTQKSNLQTNDTFQGLLASIQGKELEGSVENLGTDRIFSESHGRLQTEDLLDLIKEILLLLETSEFEEVDDFTITSMEMAPINPLNEIKTTLVNIAQLSNEVEGNSIINQVRAQGLFKDLAGLTELVQQFVRNQHYSSSPDHDTLNKLGKFIDRLKGLLNREEILHRAYEGIQQETTKSVNKGVLPYQKTNLFFLQKDPVSGSFDSQNDEFLTNMPTGMTLEPSHLGNESEVANPVEKDYPIASQQQSNSLPFITKYETLQLSTRGEQPISYKEFIKNFESILQRNTFLNNGQVQRLSIKLYPEHLGTLQIELVQQQNEMVAKIISSTTSTRDLLEQHVGSLKQAFVQQNVNVSRIDLVSQLAHEETFQDGNPQQQGSNQRDAEEESQPQREQGKLSFKETLLNYEI